MCGQMVGRGAHCKCMFRAGMCLLMFIECVLRLTASVRWFPAEALSVVRVPAFFVIADLMHCSAGHRGQLEAPSVCV